MERCLICDEGVTTPTASLTSKKGKGGGVLLSDEKSRFALTLVQYGILQKVLSLPEGICRPELTNGPYCRDCFTHINNVCHIMSALENLQESIQEFRNDFGAKIKSSFDSTCNTRNKRRNGDEYASTRGTILDYLKRSVEVGGSRGGHKLHEIINRMDESQRVKVTADMVVRTTNGDMPTKTTHKGRKTKPTSTTTFYDQEHQEHQEEDNEGKDWVCWYCKASFERSVDLKSHEAEHKASKTCPICQKHFSRSHTLNRHILTHAKKSVKKGKRLNCDDCSKIFYSKKVLKNHKAKEHKPVKIEKKFRPGRCKVCGRIVTDLQGHLDTEHPNKTMSTRGGQELTGNKGVTRGGQELTGNKGVTRAGPLSSKLRRRPVGDDPPSPLPPVLIAEGILSNYIQDIDKTDCVQNSPVGQEETHAGSDEETQQGHNSYANVDVQESKYQFKNLLKIGDK